MRNTYGPPLIVVRLLMMVVLVFASFAFVIGCGGGPVHVEAQDAHDVTQAAFDCAEAALESDDMNAAVMSCTAPARSVLATLCGSGLINAGKFCDLVAGTSPQSSSQSHKSAAYITRRTDHEIPAFDNFVVYPASLHHRVTVPIEGSQRTSVAASTPVRRVGKVVLIEHS